jgi:hypothetical protein
VQRADISCRERVPAEVGQDAMLSEAVMQPVARSFFEQGSYVEIDGSRLSIRSMKASLEFACQETPRSRIRSPAGSSGGLIILLSITARRDEPAF